MSEYVALSQSTDSLTVSVNQVKPVCTIAVSCMVCDESVELTEREEYRLVNGLSIGPKLCNKCKEAILEMREQIKLREELLDGYRMMKGAKTEDVSTSSVVQRRNTEKV